MTQDFTKKRQDEWTNLKNGMGAASHAQSSSMSVNLVTRMTRVVADNLWRKNHLARIAITELPSEALRRPYEVRSESIDNLHDICSEYERELGLNAIILEAWNMARAHGGAWLMLVTDDVDVHDLGKPLKMDKNYHLQNIVIASTDEVTPTGKWIDSPASRRFRSAEFYTVNLRSHGGSNHYSRVHHSRLIYIAGRRSSYLTRLAQNGYDDSVLLDIETPLQDKWSSSRSMAELMYKAQLLFFQAGNKKATLGSKDSKDSLKERIKHIFEGATLMGMPVIFEGEDILQRVASFANLDKVSDKFTEDVGSALRMAMTRLQGQAPGGFNTDGSSQQANWFSIVSSAQQQEIGPVIEQVWTAILGAKDGPTQGKTPKGWKIVWPPLDEPTEQMKIEQRQTNVNTINSLFDRGLVNVVQAQALLCEDEYFASHLTDEAREKSEEEEEEDNDAVES